MTYRSFSTDNVSSTSKGAEVYQTHPDPSGPKQRYSSKNTTVALHTNIYFDDLSLSPNQKSRKNNSSNALSLAYSTEIVTLLYVKWIIVFVCGVLSGLGLATSLHAILHTYSLINNESLYTFDDTQSPYVALSRYVYKPAETKVLPDLIDSSFVSSQIDDSYISKNFINPKKPSLTIHIGPHKTASTSLQADLTEMQDYLRKDNYAYVGRLYQPYTNQKTGQLVLNRRPDSPILIAMRHMFSPANQVCQRTINKTECCSDLQQMLLDTYYTPFVCGKNHESGSVDISKKHPPNILISDEAILKLLNQPDFNSTYNIWRALYEVLTPTWDVTIVAAYRRFYDWIPSAKSQRDKPTLEPWKTEWPRSDRGELVQSGIPLQPLFPDVYNTTRNDDTDDMLFEWKRHHFLSDNALTTIKMLQEIDQSKRFEMKIYHLYSKKTLRSNFLCNVMRLEHSCRESRRREKHGGSETWINDQNERNPDTISKRVNQSKVKSIAAPLAYFDAIATTAAEFGLINTSIWRRQKVASMLYEFDRTIHHRAVDLNLTHLDLILPLKCPTKEQLTKLIRLSLSIEAEYLPKLFYKGHMDHQIAFQNKVDSKTAYCWIDTDAIFTVGEKANNPSSTSISSFVLEYIKRTFS